MKPIFRGLAAGIALLAAGAPLAAPAQAQALPALDDIGALWKQQLDGDVQASLDAYDVLGKFYDDGELVPGCKALLPELDRAIAKVPVAVSMWRAGELCAREQVKDPALEKRYGDGVAALAAYALARDSSGPWDEPIRVLNINDALEIEAATGWDVLYRYGNVESHGRYLRLYTALEDPEGKVERHLSFDMLDSLYHIRNEDELSGYPGYRRTLREVLVKSFAENGDDAGKDLKAEYASRELSEPAQRVAALREAAADGGLESTASWLAICAAHPFAGCADGLVDAMLPYAEKDLAAYRVELALAYALGVGVDQDPDAAIVLLDAAEKRWPGSAYAFFAEQYSSLKNGELPAKVMAQLEKDGHAGSARATVDRIYALLRKRKSSKMEPAELAEVKAVAEAGNRAGRELMYLHFHAVGDEAAAQAWLERGAAAGDASAQQRLAMSLLRAKERSANFARVEQLMRAAAQGGNEDAMRWMGVVMRARGQWKEAENWFQSGVAYEDTDALRDLVLLYGKPHPGLTRGPKEAMQFYEKLETGHYDSAAYRRNFAEFLLQPGEFNDPARARKLLEGDAQVGDMNSQYALGVGLIRGRFGKVESDAGLAWVKKAMAQGPGPSDSFAHHLYYRERSDAARARAFDIERELAKQKDAPAINNLAWWLCTSENPKLRNPAEGLEVAKGLGDPATMVAGTLDTYAACEAATGQFDAAARHQRQVVDEFRFVPSSGTPVEKFQARLDGYLQKRAFIETREEEPADE